MFRCWSVVDILLSTGLQKKVSTVSVQAYNKGGFLLYLPFLDLYLITQKRGGKASTLPLLNIYVNILIRIKIIYIYLYLLIKFIYNIYRYLY